MKFSCEKLLLQNAVNTASRAVAAKSSIPALEGLLLTCGGESLTVSGYNMQTGIRTKFAAEVEESGELVVNARLISEILRRLPDDVVTFTANEKFLIHLTCGDADFDIMGLSAADFPELPEVEEKYAVQIAEKTLKTMIQQTSFAVSTNEARPVHMGSLFEVSAEGLTVVSVDGFRLALRKEALEKIEGGAFSFVAPGTALSPIACAYIRARGADRLCSYGDWAALSDECDAATAAYLKNEVSDGIIAPAYSDEALAILKTKKGGKYNIVQIDPAYTPAPLEQKDVFGITFEQGHNDCKIDESLLTNIVTENKDLPEGAKRDMLLALITLKYTQSNSVCYVKDGQAIGVGAGQQSRIHCTRLAGQKADNWYLRRHPKVLALPFVDGIRRPDRDNAIDVYISDECEDVLADGAWQRVFKERPEALSAQERKEWIARQSGVTVGSDAFFPFGDNVERARKSGVSYIVEPGGSIRDDNVIETANRYGITMTFTGMRLFHH